MGPKEWKVTQATIPDLVVDLRALAECVQDMAMENMTGDGHMADAKALLLAPRTQGPGARSRPARRRSLQMSFSAPRRPTARLAPLKTPRGL